MEILGCLNGNNGDPNKQKSWQEFLKLYKITLQRKYLKRKYKGSDADPVIPETFVKKPEKA